MKFSKNQIIAILLLNFAMLVFSVYGLIISLNVSTIRTVASIAAASIFLFFIIIVSKKYYGN